MTHSSVDERLVCFHFLAIVARAEIHTDVQGYPRQVIGSFEQTPRSFTAGTNGRAILAFPEKPSD